MKRCLARWSVQQSFDPAQTAPAATVLVGAALAGPILVAAALAAAVLAASLTPLFAAEPAMHAGQLAHEVDRLMRTGRVLYIAAHPDDENTRLLTFLANGRHLLTGYLTMTRGGGGQNLVGTEQGELLDVIRTEELAAARSLDGAVQRFTRMRDFGYSKTADETFATWGHDEALSDVVWVIRTFQPDVIITRFDELPPNHGHHTASAILAREAFTAAADPERFPDQLKDGVEPWRTERLLYNLASWREGPVPKDAMPLDVGAYDPRTGMGYGELAALSRSRHASQGFGVAGERGPLVEQFVWLAGSRPEKDVLDGIDVSWNRFGHVADPLVRALAKAPSALNRDHPEAAILTLLEAHRAFDALPDVQRVRDGRRALDRLIGSVLGLFVRAVSARPSAVPGSEAKVDVEIVLRSRVALTLRNLSFPGVAPVEMNAALAANEKKVVSQVVPLKPDAAISAPYWLAERSLPGRQVVREQRLVGEPAAPPALSVGLELGLEDRTIRLIAPVVYAWVDPVQGERTRPFLVVPPATVTPSREAVMFPNGGGAPVVLRVRAGRDVLRGDISLPLPAGWRARPESQPVSLAKAGEETTVRFEVTPPPGARPAEVRPTFTGDGKSWSWREAVIDHPHIPLQVVLQPAFLKLVPLALKLPKGRVGYIQGSGDTVAEDLAHVGLKVEVLDDEMLRSGDLSGFAAIVVGIRAWNTREIVRGAHPRLMAYVERGGSLVVQYNTNNRLAPLTTPLGPYPFEIGRDRITDENAAMTAVNSKHAALHVPNEIVPADFEGWVQERGIYYATTWDARYETLFTSQDPGEKPLLGGTLIARHGKGRYVYTGLAFFRQLPAGVPGAYRLFINLLAKD